MVSLGGGYTPLRMILGLFLLTAAGLKAYQLATEPVAGSAPLAWRWLVVAELAFEAGLGVWLLAGVWASASWGVTMGCFMLFACVSAWKGFQGEASCGCFGRVSVSPVVHRGS